MDGIDIKNLKKFKLVHDGLMAKRIVDEFETPYLVDIQKYLSNENPILCSLASGPAASYEVDLLYIGILEQFEAEKSQSLYDLLQLVCAKYRFMQYMNNETTRDYDCFSNDTIYIPVYIWLAYWLEDADSYKFLVELSNELGKELTLGFKANEGFDFYHQYWACHINFIVSAQEGELVCNEDSGPFNEYYSNIFQPDFIDNLVLLHWDRAVLKLNKKDDVFQDGALPIFPIHTIAYWKLIEKIENKKFMYDNSILKPYRNMKFEKVVKNKNAAKIISLLEEVVS